MFIGTLYFLRISTSKTVNFLIDLIKMTDADFENECNLLNKSFCVACQRKCSIELNPLFNFLCIFNIDLIDS